MSPPNMYRSLRLFAAGLIIFCVFSALTILYGNQQSRIQNLFNLKGNSTSSDAAIEFKVRPERLKDVTNSTLGVSVHVGPWCSQRVLTSSPPQFQKVFVINLPERPDKLDQFAIVSSLTGFKADVIEGVKGSEIMNKSLPALEGLPDVRPMTRYCITYMADF